MDPASAIGVASGAITFLEFTYKFMTAVHTIYDERRPTEYASLEESCQQMKDLPRAFVSQSSSGGQSQDEAAIISLANQCYVLAADIIRKIEKTKARKRQLPEILKAALKSVRSRDDISRLQHISTAVWHSFIYRGC